jgi:hypothetical protein
MVIMMTMYAAAKLVIGEVLTERQHHLPTRPVDRDKAEAELMLNIKKATSPEETAPKQKHVRSTE